MAKTKAELSHMTKPQLIDYSVAIMAKIQANLTEEMLNRISMYKKRIDRLDHRLMHSLPKVSKHRKVGLSYYKSSQMPYDKFAMCTPQKLTIDKYQIDSQIYTLPDELKIIEHPVVMLAMFDYNKEFRGFGMLNRQHEHLYTFHTNPYSMCLGEDRRAVEIVNFKQPMTILEGMRLALETLETVNPSSYLNGEADSMTDKFRKTKDFIDEQYKEYSEQEICLDCNRPFDECECSFCERCDCRYESDHYDVCDCPKCSHCGATIWDHDEECGVCGYVL